MSKDCLSVGRLGANGLLEPEFWWVQITQASTLLPASSVQLTCNK